MHPTHLLDQALLNDFIQQIPGLFAIIDLESKFLAMNNVALNWKGFESTDAMIGKTYCDIPCKIAEQHEAFVQQDIQIQKRNSPMRILGDFCHRNNDWKLLFGEKYPLKNKDGEIMATISHFNDITHYHVFDLSKFLNIAVSGASMKIDRHQISLNLEDNYLEPNLSDRQSECLFFLLRGKTSREIAKILNLSVRTVETYIEQIKYKFKCSKKSQIIEQAIAKGFMNIFPKSLLKILK